MRKKKKVNANETYMQTVMRRFRAHHLAKISLVILVVVGLAALFAPVVAPYDPDAIVGTFSGAPCKEFILGTDQIGRDVFSRLKTFPRTSLATPGQSTNPRIRIMLHKPGLKIAAATSTRRI